ncbi:MULTISPECIES: TrkA family potassium uptake protein [Moorena]|uniref:potassium channel family protein n=1 Tax=Moorena TaxID=1155738 RepID=UPI000307F52B|nr:MULTISPECIES: TrkA family potassium uptake protein [Moorena]NEP35039.1 TrkA family potassium uptake protein [Moorena sp. SIO3B2]NEP69841.1 TrkA family potassium uptake protein [Moorena sp. SIO3A5]NEQ07774.1 TrkA family potassium uptake protein [Moorena sp. SIO4E2]NER85817.1 TrkA family potassium uptake protein [Moorena sp. SIO3A2]NES41459.1 TrkA family potassium uptake protein [Moorena sp. SIO2C4]
MNLSFLTFLRNLPKENKQFAVIGLGRFGRAVCSTLYQLGYEVLGTDIDEKLVSQVLTNKIASHAVQLDSKEPSALKEAGILEFDTVIIAIGNYVQESIITTLNLKEAGVPYVIAKASSEVHGKLLKRVGADHVVFPENDAGCALARSLTKPSILEWFDLDSKHSIVEVRVPEKFDGKSIMELELRKRYGLTVLAIKGDAEFEINPDPNQLLYKDMLMVIIGSNADIDRLPI